MKVKLMRTCFWNLSLRILCVLVSTAHLIRLDIGNRFLSVIKSQLYLYQIASHIQHHMGKANNSKWKTHSRQIHSHFNHWTVTRSLKHTYKCLQLFACPNINYELNFKRFSNISDNKNSSFHRCYQPNKIFSIRSIQLRQIYKYTLTFAQYTPFLCSALVLRPTGDQHFRQQCRSSSCSPFVTVSPRFVVETSTYFVICFCFSCFYWSQDAHFSINKIIYRWLSSIFDCVSMIWINEQ